MSGRERKVAAACSMAGSLLLFIGTWLHPMQADPNHAAAAFAEYASDRLWVATHLTQLAGIGLIVAALLLLARDLEAAGGGWARIAAGGAVASLSVAAALQAVDGIALKKMVDAWAAAAAPEKAAIFHAAFAVRQIEIGLASLLCLCMGLTVLLYAAALRLDSRYPKWLGPAAIVGGLPLAVSGVVMAYAGFSSLEMAINMPAGTLLLAWTVGLGIVLSRRGAVPGDRAGPDMGRRLF